MATEYDCQTCGACCAYAADWPRFTLESEAALALIPPHLVDEGRGRMRWAGGRCAALKGEVGVATRCSIYEVRPQVCRACEPGDDACLTARRRHGLEPLGS
jgi:Fe-S-cluster containining protein